MELLEYSNMKHVSGGRRPDDSPTDFGGGSSGGASSKGDGNGNYADIECLSNSQKAALLAAAIAAGSSGSGAIKIDLQPYHITIGVQGSVSVGPSVQSGKGK